MVRSKMRGRKWDALPAVEKKKKKNIIKIILVIRSWAEVAYATSTRDAKWKMILKAEKMCSSTSFRPLML